MDIKAVIRHFGTQAKLAKAISTTQPAISNWKKRKRIPALQQLRIEAATGGKFKADKSILER